LRKNLSYFNSCTEFSCPAAAQARQHAGSADLSDEACFDVRMMANAWRSRIRRQRRERKQRPEEPRKHSPGFSLGGQRNTLRPVRAGETYASINPRYSACQKEHYTVSDFHCPISRPYRAITVWGELPRLKPGLSSQGPSGRHADLSDDVSRRSFSEGGSLLRCSDDGERLAITAAKP
jgi:hypothetical protein